MQVLGTSLLIAHEHDLATVLTEGRDLIWGNADLLIMLQRCESEMVCLCQCSRLASFLIAFCKDRIKKKLFNFPFEF